MGVYAHRETPGIPLRTHCAAKNVRFLYPCTYLNIRVDLDRAVWYIEQLIYFIDFIMHLLSDLQRRLS